MGAPRFRPQAAESRRRGGCELATRESDRLAGRRIALTGGVGFIGSHLVPSLLAAGAEVDLLSAAALSRDASELGRELVHFDSVVHLGYRRPETAGYWSQLGGGVGHAPECADRPRPAAPPAPIAE